MVGLSPIVFLVPAKLSIIASGFLLHPYGPSSGELHTTFHMTLKEREDNIIDRTDNYTLSPLINA
jgi:hypothetical protein